MVRLGDVCKFQSGGTPAKGESSYFNGSIPWITTVALNGSIIGEENAVDWITEKAIKESAAKIVPANSVMVGTRVGVGKVAINRVPMSTSQDIISLLDIDESKWSKDFICKFILGKGTYLNSQARGATIKGIKIETLAELPLPNISLEQQCKIAVVINNADKLIALRKEQLEKLDRLVKSRFIELFGGYSETIKLSEVAAVTGGLTKNAKRDQLPLRMPYLRVANVAFASIDATEILDIGLTKDEYEKTLLQYEDLLFVEGNGSPDQIGRVAIWRNEITPCVHQNHLIKSRFDQSKVTPVFAMHYFMSQRGRDQIKSKAVSTSGLYTLSVSKVAELLMPIPPIDLQKRFAAFVKQTDKSKYYSRLSLALCRVSATLFGQEWMKCQTSNS